WIRIYRRPHWGCWHITAWLDSARCGPVPLSLVRRPDLALRNFGTVRPLPGRHRPELRHHRARVFPATRSAAPPWAYIDGNVARHGARRLDVGLDIRSDRFLPGGVPERPRLESGERIDHGLALTALTTPCGFCLMS